MTFASVALVVLFAVMATGQMYPAVSSSEEALRIVTATHTTLTSAGTINFLSGRALTKAQLCSHLLTRRNTAPDSGTSGSITNARFDGVTLTLQDCETALDNAGDRDFLTSEDDLNAWKGWHCGEWMDGGQGPTDPALWYTVGDAARAPLGRRQDVVWPSRSCWDSESSLDPEASRYGFNQLHSDFLWGLDPKRCTVNRQAEAGASLGYGFHPSGSHNAHCIVWIAPSEAFLECVNQATRKKTSAGSRYYDALPNGQTEDTVTAVGGHGQWTMGHDRCGATVVHFENDQPANANDALDTSIVNADELRALVFELQSHRSRLFSLFGHASHPGSEDVNYAAAERRINYVIHHLTEAGIRVKRRLRDAAFVPIGCIRMAQGRYSCGESAAFEATQAASRTVEAVFQ